MNYDFEIERINSEIKKRKAKSVLIQLPEGLKVEARNIMDKIKADKVIFSADACFGACDLKTPKEIDLIVHFAHSKMLDNKNVIYVECHSDLEIKKAVENAIPLLKCKNVGLVTTTQHIHKIDEARKLLEESGKKAIIGKKGKRATYDGQVLGCDASSALNAVAKGAECFLFIGSGEFHPLFTAYSTGKTVIQANPYSNEAREIKANTWERDKYIRMEKAHDARHFGIIYSEKPGQKNFALAESLKSLSDDAYLISMEYITPDIIDYLPFDAFVITACPRIVLDDWKNYTKPILLPDEFKEMMK